MNLLPAILVILLNMLVTTTALAEQVYRFGVVPQYEPRMLYSIWKPILVELEQRTGLRFKLVGTADIPAFEQEFTSGAYDVAYVSPYQLLSVRPRLDYIPLVRDSATKLEGIVVVRRDDPIKSAQELSGAHIAFPSPNALGASLLVRATLAENGVTAFTPEYVATHSSVYLHVAQGLVQAGGGVSATLQAQPREVRDQLRVLVTTPGYAPHPVAAHRRVPEALRNKIRDALIAISATPSGKALMARIPMQRPVIASMNDYQPIARLHLERLAAPPDGTGREPGR